MSQRQAIINHCDQCLHEWIPKPGVNYTHCTSGKCRSRKWDKDAVKVWVKQAEDDGLLIPGSRNATGIERMIESKRAAHDPKTCRIYRCGMCASK